MAVHKNHKRNYSNKQGKLRAVIMDFIFPILSRKMVIFLLAYLFIISLSLGIQGYALTMLALAFAANLIIYLTNDIFDYRSDIKERPVRVEKLLARGVLNRKEYYFMIAACIICLLGLGFISPTAGIIVVILILVNLARSFTSSYTLKTVLLFFVEMISFEIVWWIISGQLIPAVVLPIFMAYSMIYSVTQYIYKKNMFHTLSEFKTLAAIVTALFLFTVLASTVPLLKHSAYPVIALLLIVLISGLLFSFVFKKYFVDFYKKGDVTKYNFVNMITINYLIIFAILLIFVFPSLRELSFPVPVPNQIECGINYVVGSVDSMQGSAVENVSQKADSYRDMVKNKSLEYAGWVLPN